MSRTFKNRKFKLTSYAKNQPVQLFFTFLTTITRWSYSTANYYVLIGQNLTGEFIHKIYAASGTVCTDSWNWQSLVSSCDVFSTGCSKWNTAAIKILLLFMVGLFIGFLVEKCAAYQVIGNPISGGIVFLFTLLDVLKSLKRSQPNLMASRSCISTSKLE